MTEEERIQREIDLDIEVTPVIEDAFYFLRMLENNETENFDDENESIEDFEKRLCEKYTPSQNAGDRLAKIPYQERMEAIHEAYRMIDNIKKYGVACLEWEGN